jgi:hypothetical protein
MKDPFRVFDEAFQTMSHSIDNDNYQGCMNLASDLITLSALSDFAEGVFISEILEAVFSQMSDGLSLFEVSEGDRSALRQELKEGLAMVAGSYKNQDKNGIYAALTKLRVSATGFQFKSWSTMKQKEGVHVVRRRRL